MAAGAVDAQEESAAAPPPIRRFVRFFRRHDAERRAANRPVPSARHMSTHIHRPLARFSPLSMLDFVGHIVFHVQRLCLAHVHHPVIDGMTSDASRADT